MHILKHKNNSGTSRFYWNISMCENSFLPTFRVWICPMHWHINTHASFSICVRTNAAAVPLYVHSSLCHMFYLLFTMQWISWMSEKKHEQRKISSYITYSYSSYWKHIVWSIKSYGKNVEMVCWSTHMPHAWWAPFVFLFFVFACLHDFCSFTLLSSKTHLARVFSKQMFVQLNRMT